VGTNTGSLRDPIMTDPDDLLPRLRVMQIIAFALLLSLAILGGIVIYLVQVQNNGQGMQAPPDLPILSLVAVAVLVVDAFVSVIVPGMIIRNAVRQIAAGNWKLPGSPAAGLDTDAAKLLAIRQTTLIISLAFLNGPGFLGCIAYLLEAQPFVLAVIGVSFGLMLVQFPTEPRLRSWLEQHMEWVARERQDNPRV
jgi:hypothetical protein